MTDPNIRIALPAGKRLWRVRFADSIENPKISSTVLVRGAAGITEAMEMALGFEGWRNFRKLYPDADVVEVSFGGFLEN